MRPATNIVILVWAVAIGCAAGCNEVQPDSGTDPEAAHTLVAALNPSCQGDWECSAEDDGSQCIEYVCGDGKCVEQAVADGTPCSDEDSCTSGEHCSGGECTGGMMICGCRQDSDCPPVDACAAPSHCDTAADPPVCRQDLPGPCDSPPGPCTSLSCDSAAGECVPVESPDGTPCSDGLVCTADDQCLSGECVGQAVACEPAGECVLAQCVEPGACQPSALGDGTECEDGGLCLAGECCHPKCTGATCGDNGCGGLCQCQFGICDELAGICRQEDWVLIPRGEYNLGEEAFSFTALFGPFSLGGLYGATAVLTNDTLVARTETTAQLFGELMGEQPWDGTNCQGDCPADGISWYQAVEFSNKASATDDLTECYIETTEDKDQDGHPDIAWPEGYHCQGYRLPTFAEWWYWARAGRLDVTYSPNGRASWGLVYFPDSEAPLNKVGWFDVDNDGAGVPHVVGQKLPSQWGLYDILGNEPEWVYDRPEYAYYVWFKGGDLGEPPALVVNPGQDYQQEAACAELWEYPDCSHRLLLGGGYRSTPLPLEALAINMLFTYSPPGAGWFGPQGFGFRLVRTVDLRRAEEVSP